MFAPWKKSHDKPRPHIKKLRHYLANKGPYSQSYGFSSSHVWMWELDYKASWGQNWCFLTVVLEKTLESPLDCREIQPVHPKGNQFWFSLEGLMLKLQHFGHLMWRADALEKTMKLGNIEGRRRRGWQRMRSLDGITDSMDMSLGKLWGLGNEQGGLGCCGSWGCKESDTTERLTWTELKLSICLIISVKFLYWHQRKILLSKHFRIYIIDFT